ncbi:MAG: nucleotidyltransferase domain-containing protein [Chitinophagaceae bacterium]
MDNLGEEVISSVDTGEYYVFVNKKISMLIRKSATFDTTLDTERIDSIKSYFKTRPVLKAYLFGSYLHGNSDYESDVDILVDLDYSQRIGLQFIQMKLELEKLLDRKVDLVSPNGMLKYIKPIVDREKRLIYAK